jgi:hypothetical protein
VCSCAGYTPQALVDSWDWARERNERGIYREALRDVQSKAQSANTSMVHAEIMAGRPYPRCNVDPQESDYPVAIGILGLEYGSYHKDCNALVYGLGDHEQLEHEMRHAIVYKANLDRVCLEEMFVNSPPVPFNNRYTSK